MKKQLDTYFSLQYQIFNYFGYKEDWRILPIVFSSDMYWRLYGEGPGTVRFADTKKLLDDPNLNYYENEIYTQRFLPKWVYRGKDYTMICSDPHSDRNQYLQIFENSKECPLK